MAISYLTGIDLNKNQLINAQVHVCAGSGEYPSDPVDGQIIYDSVEKLLKVYKGSTLQWKAVGEPLSAGDYISIDGNEVSLKIDSTVATGDLLTVDAEGQIVASTMGINGHTLAGSSVTIEAGDIPFTNDGSGDSTSESVYDAMDGLVTTITDHMGNISNPHSVTASQLGAGTLGAGVKATTPAQSSNDTSIATTEYVTQKFGSVDALQYKGTIDGGSTGSHGALTVAANKGDVYKVSTAGKIDGVSVEVGDMLICNADGTPAATTESGDTNYATVALKWDFIQRNIDGAVTGPASSTADHVAAFSDATGKVVKDSGFTIGTSVPSGAVFTDTVVQTSSTTIAADAASPHSSAVTFSGTYLSSYAKDSSGNIVMVETQVTTSSGTTTVTFKCAQAPGVALTCVVVYI